MIKVMQRKSTITRSHEFEKKGLATHALNVGVLCGHGCLYCSTPAVLRTQAHLFPEHEGSAFKAFAAGVAIVDPTTPDRMADVLGKLQPTDTVMVSTMTDAWSPEAQEHDLGRRCLDQILRKSKARVRVLTKNAVVAKDLDLLAEFRDRVSLGLSLTAPRSKAALLDTLEPKASSIDLRLEALRAAHDAQVPIFGMLCPCLPGVADSKEDLDELFEMVMPFEPEVIWAEPVNARGNCLVLCQEALQQAGHYRVANEIRHIRDRSAQAAYTVNLVANLNAVASKWGVQERLRILVYGNGDNFPGDSSGVIWLKS